MQTAWPQANILILGIFPKGKRAGPWRKLTDQASQIAARMADGKTIHYLDIGDGFIDAQGRISSSIMHDYLHLTARGYEIWAAAMEPKLAELLGETEKKADPDAPKKKKDDDPKPDAPGKNDPPGTPDAPGTRR